MIPPLHNDDSHADDLFGVERYEAARPELPNFFPWHRPRKQFVRKLQWTEQIQRLISDFVPENNVLKYLGLPGDDLLDLRYFHQHICTPHNISLKFLGFNNGAALHQSGTTLNISLDEVRRLPFIDQGSDIIGDDIRQLSNFNSVAWSRSKAMGPYDVINFDLCDGFGSHPHNEFADTHYNAIHNLMTLQARRTNPWLLLLTTRTGMNHTEANVFEILKGLYNQNLLDCERFRALSMEKFHVDNQVSLNTICLTSKGISDIFIVAFCKWIAQLSGGQNPPSRIEVKSVMGYRVNQAEDFTDLVSIAIKIDPTHNANADRVGLATIQPTTNNECQMATQALDRVSRLVDADTALDEDKNLFKEMLTETSSLLEQARYDISTFEEWATRP